MFTLRVTKVSWLVVEVDAMIRAVVYDKLSGGDVQRVSQDDKSSCCVLSSRGLPRIEEM